MDKPGLHPCEYCGTMLDENGEVESNIAACGPRMGHYASQCVIYVHAAKESYKAEAVALRRAIGNAGMIIKNRDDGTVYITLPPMWCRKEVTPGGRKCVKEHGHKGPCVGC